MLCNFILKPVRQVRAEVWAYSFQKGLNLLQQRSRAQLTLKQNKDATGMDGNIYMLVKKRTKDIGKVADVHD